MNESDLNMSTISNYSTNEERNSQPSSQVILTEQNNNDSNIEISNETNDTYREISNETNVTNREISN